ncbi:MAG: hypothetical protein ABFD62_07205 [Syntrophaceae bacterium]
MEAKTESSFIQELEDRLNVIFAEDEKPQQAGTFEMQEAVETSALDSINVAPGDESREDLFSDLNETNSVMFSHVKDLKGIVLSLEWEINDEILEKLDNEILRLENIYPEDLYGLAFARILRFLGRYIREKSAESEPRSINLLLSTYDNLEKVLLSRKMPEAEKYSLMLENITAYRQWVEGVDLTPAVKAEGEAGEQPAARRPALQLLIGKQRGEVSRIEEPEIAIADEPPVIERASDLFREIVIEDEAAQRTGADLTDDMTSARVSEDGPAFAKVPAFAGPDSVNEIRAGEILSGPGTDSGPVELQAGEIPVPEIPAGDIRESAVNRDEVQAGDLSGTDYALAPALERIRQEIRNEIMEVIMAEIKSLRDEIKSLRDARK